MKNTTLIIAGVLLAGLAPCYSAEKTFGDGLLPSFLAKYDTNGDGRIDEEERQAIVEARKAAAEERRDEIDTDGDGVISELERKAALEALRNSIEEKRRAKFNETAGEDGLLSLEEFSSIPQMSRVPDQIKAAIFARLDRNSDGNVTFEEFTARLRAHRPRPPLGGGEAPSAGL